MVLSYDVLLRAEYGFLTQTTMTTKRLFHWTVAAVAAASVMAAACKDDNVGGPINTDEEHVEPYVQPVDDEIKTTFDADVLLLGDDFDETTSYMISRIKGQTFRADKNTTTIPESVRAVFVASNGEISEEGLKELKRRYDEGSLLLLFHKPSNAELFFYIVYFLREPDADTQSLRAKAANRSYATVRTYDIVAFGPNHKLFYLPDLFDPDAEPITKTGTINTLYEDGTTATRDTTFTVTLPEPTPYNYGRFAEAAVKWMKLINAASPAENRAITRADDYDAPHVTLVTKGWFCGSNYGDSYHDITVRLWADFMYNFDLDEDFYHVVTEVEVLDNIYQPYFHEGKDDRESAYTFYDLSVQAHWPHSDYQVRDEWKLQPWGTENIDTSTDIHGWDANAGIAIGKTGIEGKFNGGIVNLKAVTQELHDVDLSNVQHGDDGTWMHWYYQFNNQPWWSGKRGKFGKPGDPGNSDCKGKFRYPQSWDWLISDTKKRGDEPFMVEMRFGGKTRHTWVISFPLQSVKDEYITSITFHPDTLRFELPVPERYRHIYEMTLDQIDDLAEYNNLTTALSTVSSRYNELYNLLIRKDDDGRIAGRTATTEAKLKQMVGKEWYNLAQDVLGKKINVEKTYKFYVKDENGEKLQMVDDNDNEVGTYMVVAPSGITIE